MLFSQVDIFRGWAFQLCLFGLEVAFFVRKFTPWIFFCRGQVAKLEDTMQVISARNPVEQHHFQAGLATSVSNGMNGDLQRFKHM